MWSFAQVQSDKVRQPVVDTSMALAAPRTVGYCRVRLMFPPAATVQLNVA